MLEAQDLAAQRGDATLFAAVSFAVRPGAALIVTGANGSGKTTLLRIVAGLTRAAAGTLSWQRNAIAAFDPALRAAALFIGHAPALKDELTAEENLASLANLRGKGAKGKRGRGMENDKWKMTNGKWRGLRLSDFSFSIFHLSFSIPCS